MVPAMHGVTGSGRVVAGRYQLLSKIGAGATGQIGYLCGYTGSNGVPTTSSGGVCNDMARISSGCPSYGTVIRCCYGSPC